MPLRTVEDTPVVTYDAFSRYPRVTHLITTRSGGASSAPWASFNLGLHVGDNEDAVRVNRRLLAQMLGVAVDRFTFASQVHSTRVVVVDDATVGTAVESADAMVTSVPDAPLVILVADCVVVGLYDPVCGAAGIAHAGWRGTLGGIATATLRTMGQTFGTQAADVVAAIGPSIGPCCYVVGPEVVDAFYAEHPDIAPEVLGVPDFASAGSFNGAVNEDRMVLDLWKANSLQLEAAGVPAGQIDVAGACTACDTLHFFSHRAENGRTGRFAGVMMLHKGTRRPW